MDDIRAGMEAGADGVYLAPANSILSDETPMSAGDQVKTMHDVMDVTGGKPILLDIPSTSLAYSALLGAAAGAPVSITARDSDTATEMASAMEMTRNFSDPDDPLGDVAVLLAPSAPGDAATLPDNLDGVNGVLLPDPWNTYDIEFILPLMSMARHDARPVLASLSEDWREEIEDIIGFGASGLIAAGVDIADIKDAVREL